MLPLAPARRTATVVFAALLASCAQAPFGESPAPLAPAAEAFLDTLQERTFGYFWHLSDPATGLTPDRAPSESFASIAAVGFALTAYPVGVERGYVARSAAAARVLATLRFFWEAPQGPEGSGQAGHRGFFYHFLHMRDGTRFETVELSTIDTALLLGGVLFCEMYFDGASADEVAIRAYADSIYRRVDWTWAQPRPPLVTMGWYPERGFHHLDWMGYNEAMLLYVLALGSPTHAIDPAAWPRWSSTYTWGEFEGRSHVGFAPLFGHQYSHVWIDFRGIQDAYMRGRGLDYFENARRATLAQRSYGARNPGGWRDYADSVWGWTASDGPADVTLTLDGRARQFFTYRARGASYTEIVDDGTIAPTAAGGSIPFAPRETVHALMAMRRTYGDPLFSTYGFLDAFNPTFRADVPLQHGRLVPGVGWFDTDYLGIDQGPILLMAENHRTGLVWKYMRRHPAIVRGLRRAGFTGGWLDEAPATQ
ncbi:MAG TPA: glucoamylase family protein [Gemmatimonadales bacterium]|nr:glucoamylase family protein [Gemmatimonadales bacterium]